jgi:hypothetical protein
VELKLRERD